MAVETVRPEDVAIYEGFDYRDGQLAHLWIPGYRIVEQSGMTLDNVMVTIDDQGFLAIRPIRHVSGIAGYCCVRQFWIRTAELDVIEEIYEDSEKAK